MKSIIIVVSVGVIIIGGLLYVLGVPRLLKTIYLIVRITPYEQTVVGAPVILVLGDSTGYGTGASKKTETVAGRIGVDYSNYTVRNISKNGRTIGELHQAMLEMPPEPKAKLILFQIGGNDILQKHDVAAVKTELQAVFDLAKNRSEHVVMISSGNVGTAAAYADTPQGAEYDALSRAFRDMFISTAKDTGVEYVDLFKEPADDVFYTEPKKYVSMDGLHPSSIGYGYWYEALRPVIKPILE